MQFRSIQDVGGVNVGDIVDVLGVLVAVSEITALTRRDGSEAHKRTITLADASGCSIDVTLWGKLGQEDGARLEALQVQGQPVVVAAKSLRVGT